WKYLGQIIKDRTICPQKLKIIDNPRTLSDLQQLCGSINWIRPIRGVTNEDLAPLFNLLRGPPEL
ncbi:POK18 protein, partial [Machaerirhynchus nigripectus]|nr:POK18 protein [Machaerirhynchus nigripectus]